MNIETLGRGISLQRKQIECENRITMLKEWIEELKDNRVVVIASYDNPERKTIDMDGRNYLPLVESELKEEEERLANYRKEFDSL